MKRLLFLVVLGIVAVNLLRARAEHCRRLHHARVAVLCSAPSGLGDDARDRLPGAEACGDVPEGHPILVVQRESVGDIPVPILPGTRVSRAEIEPPHAPAPPHPPAPPQPPAPRSGANRSAVRTIGGRLSASEDRARDDARLQLERVVSDWLSPEVPHSWKAPRRMVDALVLSTTVAPVEKDLGTLYEATIRADLSASRRSRLIERYDHDLVARRVAVLAGILGFVLACLAALAGYIRADEATRGYYTNRLRVAAAAGIGASGVLIYRLLS